MANELFPSWLKGRLTTFKDEWWNRNIDLNKEYDIDFDYFLKELLDSLDVPYILDLQTGNLTIQVSTWLTINGELREDEYNFSVSSRWEDNEFKEIILWPYSIFLIKKNPQFLRDMIEDAKVLASEMTVQMKSHRQGDVLSSVVDSYLDEIGADKISLTVISRECCRLSAPLFSNLTLTVDVTFDDYVEHTDQLVSSMRREFPASFKRLTFDTESVNAVRKSFKRGARTLSVWKGEPKQIRYDSPDILAMNNTSTAKPSGNKALYDTLCDCGYKYYMDQGVNVVITDRLRLGFDGRCCFLISDINVITDEYELYTTDFISILRIIACLPPVSLRGFDECSSTKQFIDKLFEQEVQKYLLHNNCSYYHYTMPGDMFIFSDKATVDNMDRSEKVIGICVKHNRRYISNYMTVLTNADILYDLFSGDTVKARVIEKEQ